MLVTSSCSAGEKIAKPCSLNMKGTVERLKLLHEFISYYEEKCREGNVLLFNKPDIMGSRFLMSMCGSSAGIGGSHFQVIKEICLKTNPEHRTKELQSLKKGFEILELVCVHLFLYPWRRELRTLKKFTGNFVYFVQPVIPEQTLRQILQSIGYTVVTETEYVVQGAINTEAAKQAAFELFLARTQCEELIQLINEDRADCVKTFLEGISERDGEEKTTLGSQKTTQDFRTRNISQNVNFSTFNDVMDTNIKASGKIEDRMQYNDSLLHPTSLKDPNELFTDDSLYYNCKHLVSEDFMNKYSDLNLAQKPVFPKKCSTKTKGTRDPKQPVSEEASSFTLTRQMPESYTITNTKTSSELGSSKGRKFIQETVNDAIREVVKYTHWQRISDNIVGNSDLGESPVAFNMSPKNENLRRSITKLKIEKINNEALRFPIEETDPPHNLETTNNCETKWTQNKSKELLLDGINKSPAGLFKPDMIYHATKCVECSSDTEAVSHLKEPPSSMYIPPGGEPRQCVRISDLQPEENHFQAPSLPAEMVLIEESLYNMNLDTTEDFVVITKNNHLES